MNRAAVLIVSLVLAPMTLLAQKTSVAYDKTANFDTFKTYKIRDGTRVGDPRIDYRIVATIEAQLTARGMAPAVGKSDVTVVYHASFERQRDITASRTGGGPHGYRWGGQWGTTAIPWGEIVMRTLVIAIADSKKNEVLWRGVGVEEIDVEAKPEERDKSIAGTVKKILKDFPPKRK
jgi:Domain of unknown function (DUF4136)